MKTKLGKLWFVDTVANETQSTVVELEKQGNELVCIYPEIKPGHAELTGYNIIVVREREQS